MSNFTIEGRAKLMPDVIRNWTFEVYIPNLSTIAPSLKTEEDLVIRARSVTLPARGTEPMTSNFYGMVQHFPGKPTFGYTLPITFEETQDQIISKALYEWRQAIFNVDPTSPNAGASSLPLKRQLTRNINILQYAYNGTALEKKYVVYNCFPENVDDVNLSYDSNESVKYNATFRFDFWLQETNNS